MGDPESPTTTPVVAGKRFAEIGAAARQMRSQKVSRVRAELIPTITAIQATGAISLRAVAAELNVREIPTPEGMGNGLQCRFKRVMGR
jgi:hypothetical protein